MPTQSSAPTTRITESVVFRTIMTLKNVTKPSLDDSAKKALVFTMAKELKIKRDFVEFESASVKQLSIKNRMLQAAYTGPFYTLDAKLKISINLVNYPEFGTNVTDAFVQLGTRLRSSVLNGTFTSSLKEFSIALGANITAYSAVDSITTEILDLSYPVPNPAPPEFTSLEILGIAFSGISFLIIVFVGVYYKDDYMPYVKEGIKKAKEGWERTKVISKFIAVTIYTGLVITIVAIKSVIDRLRKVPPPKMPKLPSLPSMPSLKSMSGSEKKVFVATGVPGPDGDIEFGEIYPVEEVSDRTNDYDDEDEAARTKKKQLASASSFNAKIHPIDHDYDGDKDSNTLVIAASKIKAAGKKEEGKAWESESDDSSDFDSDFSGGNSHPSEEDEDPDIPDYESNVITRAVAPTNFRGYFPPTNRRQNSYKI